MIGLPSFAGPMLAVASLSCAAAGVGLWMRAHDARTLALVAAQQVVVAATAQHQQDQRTIAGLSDAAAKAAVLASTMTKLKEAINATPKTNSCATAPAVVALLHGLRGSPGGGHADTAPAVASVGVGLPSPAGAPGGR